jgi:hypothetical protein
MVYLSKRRKVVWAGVAVAVLVAMKIGVDQFYPETDGITAGVSPTHSTAC